MKIHGLHLGFTLAAALTASAAGQTVQAPVAPAAFGQGTIAQAPYFVVDPSGNGDYQEIAQAAAAAPDGSLIRVLPGFYTAPIVIRDKTLQLIADGTSPVICTQPMRIFDVGSGDQVVVSGLELQQGLEIRDCDGQITLQDCVTPAPPLPATPVINYDMFPNCGVGETRHMVRNSSAVTLISCAFEGARGEQVWIDGGPGHHALVVEDSTVAVYGCELIGGAGASGTSSGHFPVTSGAGGDGLQVRGSLSNVHHARLAGTGGLGGTFTPGGNGSFGVTFGCDGDLVRVLGGAAMEATHAPLALNAPAEVVAGTLGTYSISGPAGAPVYLSFARTNDWNAFGPGQGILHLPARMRVFPVGVLPASGQLSRPFPVPTPVGASLAIRLELQLHAVVGGSTIWSEPRTVLVRH